MFLWATETYSAIWSYCASCPLLPDSPGVCHMSSSHRDHSHTTGKEGHADFQVSTALAWPGNCNLSTYKHIPELCLCLECFFSYCRVQLHTHIHTFKALVEGGRVCTHSLWDLDHKLMRINRSRPIRSKKDGKACQVREPRAQMAWTCSYEGEPRAFPEHTDTSTWCALRLPSTGDSEHKLWFEGREQGHESTVRQMGLH